MKYLKRFNETQDMSFLPIDITSRELWLDASDENIGREILSHLNSLSSGSVDCESDSHICGTGRYTKSSHIKWSSYKFDFNGKGVWVYVSSTNNRVTKREIAVSKKPGQIDPLMKDSYIQLDISKKLFSDIVSLCDSKRGNIRWKR